MPPDEHQRKINNSIYTNLVANLAVNTARWTTCLIKGESAARKTIPDSWLEKMGNLVFLYNDQYKYHEEFEGFDRQYRTGEGVMIFAGPCRYSTYTSLTVSRYSR